MTKFRHTESAAEFIASGDARETDREIMEAIAFFARDLAEAEAIWSGDFGDACTMLDIWEHVTGNGLRDASDYCWGAAGGKWMQEQ